MQKMQTETAASSYGANIGKSCAIENSCSVPGFSVKECFVEGRKSRESVATQIWRARMEPLIAGQIWSLGEGRTTGKFLITIDAEGDDIWSHPKNVTTENVRFLPRFQNLCEEFGFTPTYLANYEMAISPQFIAFAKKGIKDGALEVGMHLHAWNSPPLGDFGGIDTSANPYLVEYPDEVMHSKIAFMTNLLQDQFEIPVVSHRAGRWVIDERYVRILNEVGYRADCSVTPHVKWPPTTEAGPGADYSQFPETEYFLDPSDIRHAGPSNLLELPMTIVDLCPSDTLARVVSQNPRRIGARLARKVWPIAWLRPNGRNLGLMMRLLDRSIAEARSYVEFMLHSSELMPGGSPTFRTDDSVEQLYRDLRSIFGYASRRFTGATLGKFRDRYEGPRQASAAQH